MALVPPQFQPTGFVGLPSAPVDPKRIVDFSKERIATGRQANLVLHDGIWVKMGSDVLSDAGLDDLGRPIPKFKRPPLPKIFDFAELPSAAVRVPLAAPLAIAELAGLPASETLTEFGLPPLESIAGRTAEMFGGGLGFEAAIKGLVKGKRMIQRSRDKTAPRRPQERSVFRPTGESLLSNVFGSLAATTAAISTERSGADPFTQTLVTGIAGVGGGFSPHVVGGVVRYIGNRFKTADDLLIADIGKRMGDITEVRRAAQELARDVRSLPPVSRPTVLGVGAIDPAASPGFSQASRLVRSELVEAEQRVALGRREDVTRLGKHFESQIPDVPAGEAGRIAQRGFEQELDEIIASGKPLPDVGSDILDAALPAKDAMKNAAKALFKALPQEQVKMRLVDMSPATRLALEFPSDAKALTGPMRRTLISLKTLRERRTRFAEELARAENAGVPNSALVVSLRDNGRALNNEIGGMIQRQGGRLGSDLRAANDAWKNFTRLWHESKIAKLGFTNRSGQLPETSPDDAFNIIFGDPKNRGLANIRDFQKAIGDEKAGAIVGTGVRSLIADASQNLASREQVRKFAQRFSTVLKETDNTFLREFDEAGRRTSRSLTQLESGAETGSSAIAALVSPSTRAAVKDEIVLSISRLKQKHPEFKNAVTADILREIAFQAKIAPSRRVVESTMDAKMLGKILAVGDRQLRQAMTGDGVDGLRRLQRVMAAVDSIPVTITQAEKLSRSDLTREVATIASRMFAFQRGAVGPPFIVSEAAARQVAKITNELSDGELLKMYDELLHNPDILGSLAKIEKFADVTAALSKAARNARLFTAAVLRISPGIGGAAIQAGRSRRPPPDAPPTIGLRLIRPITPSPPVSP